MSDLLPRNLSHVKENSRAEPCILSLSALEFVMMMNSEDGRLQYAETACNPTFVGERYERVYRATTLWQAESFHVEVLVGYYWTQAEAEAVGEQPMKLVLDGGHWNSTGLNILRLMTPEGKPIVTLAPNGEYLDWLFDQDVTVTKLKSSSQSKLVTDQTDYERVHIPIDNFELYPDLHCFSSLASGVKLVASLYS